MLNTQVKEQIIVGLDPGSVNFAYSIVHVEPWITEKGSTLRVTPLKTGLLSNTVKSLKDIQKQMLAFLLEVDRIVSLSGYSCSTICIEQFQSRGSKTKLLELVNLMIGGMINNYQHMEITIFSAASWKNCIKKKFDLDAEYKTITCTAHELDATLIAVYGAFRFHKLKPFNGYTQGYVKKVARMVENVSTTTKRKRRPIKNVKSNTKQKS